MKQSISLQRAWDIYHWHRQLHAQPKVHGTGRDMSIEVVPFDLKGKARETLILNMASLELRVRAFEDARDTRRKQLLGAFDRDGSELDAMAGEERKSFEARRADADRALATELDELLSGSVDVDLEPFRWSDLNIGKNAFDPGVVTRLLNEGLITREAKRTSDGDD
jgi:hypothetical protein